MHLRAEIKLGIVAALVAKTDAGAHVYPARYTTVDEKYLPAICVFTPLEIISETDKLTNERTCTVTVECLINDEDGEEKLDILSAQVERALLKDITLGGLIKSIKLKKVGTGEDSDANRDCIATVMTYEAVYYSESFYNGTFDDLKTVNVDYDSKASDRINLVEGGS